MRKTLSVYKRLATPVGDTADPFAAPVVFSACRRREVSRGMMLIYGPMLGLERNRLFEIWNAEDHPSTALPTNGDVIQEADGTRWTIKKADGIIFDYALLCICIPEI